MTLPALRAKIWENLVVIDRGRLLRNLVVKNRETNATAQTFFCCKVRHVINFDHCENYSLPVEATDNNSSNNRQETYQNTNGQQTDLNPTGAVVGQDLGAPLKKEIFSVKNYLFWTPCTTLYTFSSGVLFKKVVNPLFDQTLFITSNDS